MHRPSAIGLLVLFVATAGGAAPAPDPPQAAVAKAREADRLAQLGARVDAIMQREGVRRATWGVEVRSLARDERLLARNPGTLLVPASTAKLIALAAAVEAVGWQHTFETSVFTTGPVVDGTVQGDLVIVGSGDPGFGGRGDADFDTWIDAFRTAGIRRVEGRIIGDDNAFEDPRPGAMWAWDDLGYRTGALYGALNYAENVMTVTVAPGPSPMTPAVLSVDPRASIRPIVNRTETGTAGSDALVWPEQRPGEPFLTIAGSMPVGAPPVRLVVSAGNPTIWFAELFRTALQDEGIEVGGAAVDIDDLESPPDRSTASLLYTYRSKPLSDQAVLLMKESVNLYGEAVFRLSTGPDGGRTNDEAIEALRERLPVWGVATDAVQVVDGSGLSRRDTATPEVLVAVLRRMFDASGSSPWMQALPIAGRDGTLENRFRGTVAEAHLRAKTGTMSNIRSLAGYLNTRDGEPLAFAIIVNNFEGSGTQANAAIEAIALSLAEFSRQRPR